MRTQQHECFEARVRRRKGCWRWTGSVNKRTGYATCSRRFAGGYAHRLAYELFVGPIPPGYWIDHTCHNRSRSCAGGRTCAHRSCVNPAHLEAVPPVVNQRRKPSYVKRTHCRRGHKLTPDNLRNRGRDGGKKRAGRECKRCHVIDVRERKLHLA